MKEKNYRTIIKYLNYTNIKIDSEEFKLQLEGHPNFPSLLSYSDTLRFFNIENTSYKVENTELHLLPKKFIALSKGEFELIDNNQNNIFFSNWDHIALVIDEIKDDIKSNYSISLIKIFPIIAILFTILIIKLAPTYLILTQVFLYAAIIGLILAIEAYKKTHGKGTIIPIGVCQNKVLKTDCDFVFNAKQWNILKHLDLSEISISFFAIQIFCFIILSLLQQVETLFTIYKYVLLLFIPIAILSVYYQLFIVKKLCPICIGIIFCISVQLISLNIIFSSEKINSTAFQFYFLSSIILLLGLYYTKIKFRTFQKLKEKNKAFIKFRKNFSFFKNNLSTQKELVDIDFSNVFKFGNRSSHINLTIVTNPFCKHCKLFYPYFKQIVNHLSGKISINIILDADFEKQPEEINNSYIELAQIYYNMKEKAVFLEALNEWYILHNATNKKENWYKKYSKYFENENKAISILEEQRKWLNKNKIYYTPSIFINKLEYPSEYKREDLEYFVSEIIDDSENF